MSMEIVFLPRDGARTNHPLSPEHLAALDTVVSAFGGGRNHDGQGYQMQMIDGGLVNMSLLPEHSASIANFRNWDEQRAAFVFQVMQATDRVACLINQAPTIVLSHHEDVSLDGTGFDPANCSVRVVTSAEAVLHEVELSFEFWSDYRNQVVSAPASMKQGFGAFFGRVLKGGRA